jgi:hypothetical protein
MQNLGPAAVKVPQAYQTIKNFDPITCIFLGRQDEICYFVVIDCGVIDCKKKIVFMLAALLTRRGLPKDELVLLWPTVDDFLLFRVCPRNTTFCKEDTNIFASMDAVFRISEESEYTTVAVFTKRDEYTISLKLLTYESIEDFSAKLWPIRWKFMEIVNKNPLQIRVIKNKALVLTS